MRSFDDLAADPAGAGGPVPGRVAALLHDEPGRGRTRATPPDFSTDEWYVTMARARTWRSCSPGTRRSWTATTRTARSGWSWTSGARGGTWRRAPTPGSCTSRTPCATPWSPPCTSTRSTRHAERVVMANIAQTVNVLQAMILTDPDTGALVLTPTYHVFAMNTGHHDAAALAVHLRDVATRAGRGRHRAAAGLGVRVRQGRHRPGLAVQPRRRDGPHPRPGPARPRRRRAHRAGADGAKALDAHNTPEQLDAVAPTDACRRAAPTRGAWRSTCPPTPTSPWRSSSADVSRGARRRRRR